MRVTRYHFGRLNLIAQYQDKRDFILRGLTTWNTVPSGRHLWGFFDVHEVSDETEPYIHGFLVKLRPETEEEVADLEHHKLGIAEVENRAVAKSRWFLHVPTGLIAYQPVAGHIRDHHFRRFFVRLFIAAHEGFFVDADIQTVEERYRVLELLRRFERVHTFSLYLHPTNPSYDRVYRDVDERLKRLEAETYKEEYKADPGGPGLKVTEDPDIQGKVTMAEDGYGEATASGVLESQQRTVSTREQPVTASVPADIDSPSDILTRLRQAFAKIVERIRSE